MRYADPSRCPDCRQPLPTHAFTECPSCGLPLQGETAAVLFQTFQRADDLIAQLRAGVPTGGEPPAYPVQPPASPRRRGLSGASVPQVLLGLGALCVLVAAVVFLVVAWSWLGIGGRTAVLVGLTAAAAAGCLWLTRRELRIGAEAFAAIATGLVALDVAGAADAGWLGGLSGSGTLAACGVAASLAALALLLGSSALSAPFATRLRTRPAGRSGGALLAPQVLAPLALVTGLVGAIGATDHDGWVALAFTAAFLGLARTARRLGTALLSWAALVGAALAWLTLLTAGLGGPLTVQHLWLQGAAWPVVAAGLLVLAVPLVLDHPWVRLGAGAVSGLVLSTAVVLPVLDEQRDQVLLVLVGAAGLWAAAALVAPLPWRRAAALPAAVLALPPALITAEVGSLLLARADDAGWFTRTATDRTGVPSYLPMDAHLVPVGTAGLALVVAALVSLMLGTRTTWRWGWPTLAAVMLASVLVTASGYDVPRALVALPAALVAGALALRPGALAGLVPAAGLAALGVGYAGPSAALVAIVLAVTLAACVTVLARHDARPETLGVQVVAPFAAAGLGWTIGELTGVDPSWRALLSTALVAALAWWRPRVALEATGLFTMVLGSLTSVQASGFDLTIVAAHLTAVGAALVAHALIHVGRRPAGYAGGALLAMATWARLADLGVEQPEAYTLPTALVLLALGLWHLRRHRQASTHWTLAPGLSLATVPSLLWVLDDPLSWRALLLGAACLALVVGGAALRWSGPLVVGAVVGALLVLRELQPYSALVPPWVFIGLAGAALITVGLTWEARMNDLRRGAGYLAALR